MPKKEKSTVGEEGGEKLELLPRSFPNGGDKEGSKQSLVGKNTKGTRETRAL